VTTPGTTPQAPRERAPLAFRVTGGGTPSDEELAAMIVALTPVAAAAAPEAPRRASGWLRAARLEGVGLRPFTSVDDLNHYHHSLA